MSRNTITDELLEFLAESERNGSETAHDLAERLRQDNLRPYEVEGVERVDLKVRNNDQGDGVLFTADGKMLGSQIAHMGFYYYSGHHPNRVKMFRATFVVDDMKSDVPSGDK